jgi:hypothetical protein
MAWIEQTKKASGKSGGPPILSAELDGNIYPYIAELPALLGAAVDALWRYQLRSDCCFHCGGIGRPAVKISPHICAHEAGNTIPKRINGAYP